MTLTLPRTHCHVPARARITRGLSQTSRRPSRLHRPSHTPVLTQTHTKTHTTGCRRHCQDNVGSPWHGQACVRREQGMPIHIGNGRHPTLLLFLVVAFCAVKRCMVHGAMCVRECACACVRARVFFECVRERASEPARFLRLLLCMRLPESYVQAIE